MMKTTCVDEERIQRVDSTYLYLQKKTRIKKNAKKKIAIYTPLFYKEKKNSTPMPFGSNISYIVKHTRGVVILIENDSSLKLFLKYYF